MFASILSLFLILAAPPTPVTSGLITGAADMTENDEGRSYVVFYHQADEPGKEVLRIDWDALEVTVDGDVTDKAKSIKWVAANKGAKFVLTKDFDRKLFVLALTGPPAETKVIREGRLKTAGKKDADTWLVVYTEDGGKNRGLTLPNDTPVWLNGKPMRQADVIEWMVNHEGALFRLIELPSGCYRVLLDTRD